MPTSMPRCQVLMQPEVYAKMKLLAAFDKRTLSAMCASLIETAMELPRYKAMLDEARVSMGEEHVKPDPRKARKQEHRPITTEEERQAAMRVLGIQIEPDLPTVWSVEAAKARQEASEGMEEELVDDGQGGLYNAAYYKGMSLDEIKAWDKAMDAHIEETQAVPKMSSAQKAKLQTLRRAGEITREEYNSVAVSQPIEEGEDKLVKEVDMKVELQKTLNEQPGQLKELRDLIEAMEKLKA